MKLFLPEMKHVVNPNIEVLEKSSWQKNDLLTIVREKAPTKIILKNNEEIQLAQVFDKSDEIAFLPCTEASSSISFDKLMNAIESYGHVVIHENEKYIGYVDAVMFSKQLIHAYRKMAAYFKTILQTIDSSCTVIDSKQNVLIWTEGAESIFSVKQEDIIGRKITDFFAPERLALLKTLADGTAVTNSQHHAREDLVVMINSNPVYLGEKIIGAVVSERNITSQIRLHNELSNTTEKLFNLEKEVNKLMPSEDPFIAIKGNSSTL